MYKIINVKGYESILIKGTNTSIHGRIGILYEKFVEDIHTHGIGIVEGADYVGVTTYTESRAAEYPSLQEQQDMQYWDAMNGTTTWKDKITEIKNKYPKTQIGITSIAELPDWVVGLST